MILLDTSVLSRAFRRRRPGRGEHRVRAAVGAHITSEAGLGVPGIVLQEVLSGIRSEKQFGELQHRLVTAFSVVHPTTTDHIEAARLKNRCVGKGVNVSGIDRLIATLAIAGGHDLSAMDDDFLGIAKHVPLKLYRDATQSTE